MRFRHADGTAVHVAWHMNVPAGDVATMLDRVAVPVRMRLDVDRLGLCLWLGTDAIADLLADPAAVRRLRRELAARDLDVITLDAVNFDAAGGYQPDWADPRRPTYTLACAGLLTELLTELLPDNVVVHGSVGTLPLGWRTPWTPARAASAQLALDGVADGLAELHWATGCASASYRSPAVSSNVPVVKAQVSAAAELPGVATDQPWRLHVHLPLSATPGTPLSATVEALFDRIAGARTDHVEVGAGVELDTIDTAVAELAWTRDRLIQVGLKEV